MSTHIIIVEKYKRCGVHNMSVNSYMIGERIREVRVENDLSQERFAKAFNMSQQNLSRYERGEIQVPYSDLVNIAEYFKLPIDYFLCLEHSEYTKDERLLVYYYRLIDERMKSSAIKLLKSMAKEFPGEQEKIT